MGSKLKKCVRNLEKQGDNKGAASVIMNYAELTGQLIRKSETKVTDAQRDEIRQAVRTLLDMKRSDNGNSVNLTESHNGH